MTAVAEHVSPVVAGEPHAVNTTGASVETDAPEADMTAAERAWIAKWLDRSPEWSTEKWNRMGHLLGVQFS